MAESPIEFPERRAARYEAQIQQAKRELRKIRWRLVSSNATLAFLKVLKSARQFVDGTIVWRPGAILIVATMIGGVGIAVFQSPAFGAVGVAVAIVSLFVLLLFPSDAKVTERAERLQTEQAEMKSKAPGIATRQQELEQAWQVLSDKLQKKVVDKYLQRQALRENARPMAKTFTNSLDQVFSAAQKAVRDLEYKVESLDKANGLLNFKTGLSVWSWAGQSMSVMMIDNGNGTVEVSMSGVRNQSGVVIQVIDFGEAAGIASKVFAKMGEHLLAETEARRFEVIDFYCPECEQVLTFPVRDAGRKIYCENCSSPTNVPLTSTYGLPRQAKRTSPAPSERLRQCPDCDEQVSKRAETCPHCGCPLNADS